MFSLSQTAYFIIIFEVFKNDCKDFTIMDHLNQDFLDILSIQYDMIYRFKFCFSTWYVNIKYYNIFVINIYEIKVDNA